MFQRQRSGSIQSDEDTIEIRITASEDAIDQDSKEESFSWQDAMSHSIYISNFAILGTVLRIYLGRCFGLDCEMKNTEKSIDDLLTPIFSNICVTASGVTEQTGGAIFTDLPANMLGW